MAVDEDPTPYVVQWGLLNKDTIVGDSRAAAEWSRNVVTHRDRAHVVESSNDLQIELLGAQALASVCPSTFLCLFSTFSLLVHTPIIVFLLCRPTHIFRLPCIT